MLVRIQQYCTAVFLSGVVLFVSACSSSSDPVVQTTGGQGTPMSQVRVVSFDEDLNDDGVTDRVFEFAYDTDGRVTTVTKTDIRDSALSGVTSYTYQDASLVSQVSGDNVTLYTIENGRTVAEENTDNELQRYTYDSSGRMASVEGDAFFLDDDCDVPPVFGADPETVIPRYSLQYDGSGRLVQIEGSEGDNVVVGYLANGNVDTIMTTSACSGDDSTTAQFNYDSNNLPVGSLVTDSFGEETETRIIYEAGRVVSVIEIFSDFSGFTEVDTVNIAYAPDGLVDSIARTLDVNGVRDFGTTRTFRYENQACVEQVFSNPVRNDVLLPLSLSAELQDGLRCGYLAQQR